MSESSIRRLRRVTEWCGTLMCLIMVFALADGLQAMMRTGTNTHALLPGEAIALAGPIPPSAESAEELLITSTSPHIGLEFSNSFKSYWLGGRMWQGTLTARADTHPGDYEVSVRAPGESAQNPALLFKIALYPSQSDRDWHSPSLLRKRVGIHPFAAAAAMLPVALGIFGAVFVLSQKLERHMLGQGKAEIYMLKKTPDGLLVSFGMGTSLGLSPGMALDAIDESGFVIAHLRVTQCSERDACAVVEQGGPVELGHVAALPRHPSDSPSP